MRELQHRMVINQTRRAKKSAESREAVSRYSRPSTIKFVSETKNSSIFGSQMLAAILHLRFFEANT